MEVFYWIITLITILILTFIYFALKSNLGIWTEKDKDIFLKNVKNFCGIYAKFLNIVNSFMIIFTIVLMNDFSLAFLFIFTFFITTILKNLLLKCIDKALVVKNETI